MRSGDAVGWLYHGRRLDCRAGGLPFALHAASSFGDEASAAAYAQGAFGASIGETAALQVGADIYLFYSIGTGSDAVAKLDGINAALIDQSASVIGTGYV